MSGSLSFRAILSPSASSTNDSATTPPTTTSVINNNNNNTSDNINNSINTNSSISGSHESINSIESSCCNNNDISFKSYDNDNDTDNDNDNNTDIFDSDDNENIDDDNISDISNCTNKEIENLTQSSRNEDINDSQDTISDDYDLSDNTNSDNCDTNPIQGLHRPIPVRRPYPIPQVRVIPPCPVTTRTKDWDALVRRLAIGWLYSAKLHNHHDQPLDSQDSQDSRDPHHHQEPAQHQPSHHQQQLSRSGAAESKLSPDHAVILLCQPSVTVYASIARQLRKRDSKWLCSFLQNHGLEILFETFEAATLRYNSNHRSRSRSNNRKTNSNNNAKNDKEDPINYLSPLSSSSLSSFSSSKYSHKSKWIAGLKGSHSSHCSPREKGHHSVAEASEDNNSDSDSFFGVLLQVCCVECISIVMDSQHSLDYIIENEEFIHRFATGQYKLK